ncbi:hypothetical protein [Parasutterella muris]|uniref:Y-family DNA polymerase n=2 Tax=Parasutterella TaxID=577310 RepID=UPI00203CCD96|nr:hypothetical protein [Parasutterella muris]
MKEHSQKVYAAIDLKSFYASVECFQRNLDPLDAMLVVADPTRTSKTICLAVSPALKSLGVSSRPRLFEVEARVKAINAQRRAALKGKPFSGKTESFKEYASDPTKELSFVIAPPQMAQYIKTSTKIYETYLELIAAEDIHVYSIDEVFIDITPYLETYALSAHDLTMKLIRRVLARTGITATGGIGPNLYLAKIAMDIMAKHIEADKDGVRIAELTVESYRQNLWSHRPLRDFWRVGAGYARSLEKYGIFTMGDIARCSLANEELLYRLFGVNAELLIDHAWGYEPCTIAEIKAYRPEGKSVGSGQVLQDPYTNEKALLVTREMADSLGFDLLAKNLKTAKLVLTVGYDIENLTNPSIRSRYHGEIKTDNYGRSVPKATHGTINLDYATSSSVLIRKAAEDLFNRIVNPILLVRRINISAVITEESEQKTQDSEAQLDLFGSFDEGPAPQKTSAQEEKEDKVRKAILAVREKFGKNALIKGMNLEEGATGQLRNNQIGGHKA